MNPVDEFAIAEFLQAGGRVSRIKESVEVSEAAGDLRPYIYQGKRVSAAKLVAIANHHRRSLELPPFSLRVAIRYTRPNRSN